MEAGFVAVPDGEEARSERSFSVGLVVDALDADQSARAFGCDFMAVAATASLLAVDREMLRHRAGPSVDDRVSEDGRLGCGALLALGLAAFAIDGSVDACVRRILAMADTLSALKRARRFSCPGWGGSGAFPVW